MSEPINGVWNQWQADQYHQSSPKLAKWLGSYLPKDEHVIDMGCGQGYYISELTKKGFECTGVEGYPLNNFLHNRIAIHDLTQPIHLTERGSVLSLEVLEHIEAKYENIVLDSIARHCTKHLILSWAEIGQPGIGHINCVYQKYAIRQVEERGFKYLPKITNEVRKNWIDKNTSWFTRTLLVFERA